MRTVITLVVALAVVSCTPAPTSENTSDNEPASSFGPDLGGVPEEHWAPMHFLFDMYKHYENQKAFSPFAESAPRYFDGELLALIREDDRLRGDEIGALDHDPVCQCQDYEKFHVSMKVESTTALTARVKVYLQHKTEWPPREVTYDLVKTEGNWRIHDLSSATMSSLRAHLIQSNTELARNATFKAR